MEITAVCISERKGTPKRNIGSCEVVEDHGLLGDAHAGKWHRQVSLLSYEVIKDFEKEYGAVEFGAFGENLVVSGCALSRLRVGSRIIIGDVILEVTQIGKECHSGCSIAKRTGKCIMPEQGVFARVLSGGMVSCGDAVTVEERFTAAAVTISDTGYSGERGDVSGPVLSELMRADGFEVTEQVLIPDEYDMICSELIRLCNTCDLIITTGGTGLSERDVTPEATEAVGDRRVPGIAEAIRAGSMRFTEKAMIGRGSCVTRGRTLIINFPGSPKAVRESYGIIRNILRHGLGILTGTIKG